MTVAELLELLPSREALMGAVVRRNGIGAPCRVNAITFGPNAVAHSYEVVELPPLYRDPTARYCLHCNERLGKHYSPARGLEDNVACSRHGYDPPILHGPTMQELVIRAQKRQRFYADEFGRVIDRRPDLLQYDPMEVLRKIGLQDQKFAVLELTGWKKKAMDELDAKVAGALGVDLGRDLGRVPRGALLAGEWRSGFVGREEFDSQHRVARSVAEARTHFEQGATFVHCIAWPKVQIVSSPVEAVYAKGTFLLFDSEVDAVRLGPAADPKARSREDDYRTLDELSGKPKAKHPQD